MPELVFKGKEFVYNHHMAVPHRPLVPHAEKSVGAPRLDGNLIIHGDNLEALKALLPLYAGKVDCIFIDPPYNTGNEGWCYNDNVNSPMIREWLDSNPVGIEDGLRHDKWLAMMWPRLRLLHELLADTGFIFVTLDDNEMARFRTMMDEVFGDSNFIAQIIVQSNKRGQTYKQIAKTHEYLICYGKTLNGELAEVETNGTNLPEEDSYGKFSSRELRNRNPQFGSHNRPNLFYPVYVLDEGNEAGEHPVSIEAVPGAVAVLPFNSTGGESCWRWGREKVSSSTANQSTEVLFARRTREGEWRIFEKYRKETVKAKTIWNENKHIYEQGTAELGEIGLADRFQFPKPLGLLEDCLALATDEDSLVLDSFAGSGTTAHAVLAANRKDGGSRKFILVECEDYADRLTAERVRRVINGYEFVGSQREELLPPKRLTFTDLRNAGRLLDQIASIENLEAHRFDSIEKKVKEGELVVEGVKAVRGRAEGLGGSFTYCTLGEAVDMDRLLRGEGLPDFMALGAVLFHTATGEIFDPAAAFEQGGHGYLGESSAFHVWLIYKPELDFLKSREAALTLSKAQALVEKKPGKRHLVFAPARFVSQKLLNEAGLPVEFAPLPFALYRVERR